MSEASSDQAYRVVGKHSHYGRVVLFDGLAAELATARLTQMKEAKAFATTTCEWEPGPIIRTDGTKMTFRVVGIRPDRSQVVIKTGLPMGEASRLRSIIVSAREYSDFAVEPA
jgi:hypothetical protein